MSLHGLLLLDKPEGLTSHDVVARVRRLLDLKSVGHCGTLDPMATGLMVLLLGEATKVSPYLLERDKAYRVRAQLGVRFDTLDTTGALLEQKPVDVTAEKVREEALRLQGEFNLPVPVYSAIKVKGEKLYEKARRNEVVEAPYKIMKFYDVQVLAQGPDWIEVSLSCSKGSYIRSWVELLGQNLGTGAAMSALRRTSSQPFQLDQAMTLESLAKLCGKTWSEQPPMPSAKAAGQGNGQNAEKAQHRGPKQAADSADAGGGVTLQGRTDSFLSLALALPHWKTLRVAGQDAVLIRNGQISHDLKVLLIGVFQPGQDEGVKILARDSGEMLALVGLEEGRGFVVRRVFRY